MTARARSAAVMLAALTGLLVYAIFGLRMGADFSAFLPRSADATQRVLVAQLREGIAGRLLLIELSGSPPAVLARQSADLSRLLAGEHEFRYVANGGAGLGERELDMIRRYRYLLSDEVTPERFSVEGLRAALEARLEDLYGSAAPLEKQTLASDPTGEIRNILRRVLPAAGPSRVHGVWFDRTQMRALLVAETAASGADLDGQARAVHALDAAFASVAGGTMTRIRYSSPGVMALESRSLIASQAALLTAAAALGVTAILAWTYRSPAAVALCALPALFGWLAGVVAVDVAFGGINGITLAFGATLLGEAVDYPSFLLTQAQPGEPLRETRRRVGPWLRLAVLTTACGSVALLLSGFRGLAQLGLLTAVGVCVAGWVTWHGVPLWIPQRWRPRPHALAGAAARRWRVRRRDIALLIVFALVATVALAWGKPIWDDDPARLNPLPHDLALRDRELREEIGAPDARMLVLALGASLQDVLQRTERVAAALAAEVAAGHLGGYDAASDYVPSETTQALRRAALPAPRELHQRLQAAASGMPFRPDAFAPFERDVEAARALPFITPALYDRTALGVKLGALLGRDGDAWHSLVPLRGVRDANAIAKAIAALRDPPIRLLDLRTETAALLAAYRRQALLACGAAAVLIAGVLATALRSTARAMLILAPVAIAVVLTGGLLVGLSQPMTIFHLIALLLVVGVGVNYAMFVLRARNERVQIGPTLRTLAVVGTTTLCGFAGLALSTIPALHAIGLTVCIGVLASLAFSIVLFAPAPESARAS